jgi:hypothetical protein
MSLQINIFTVQIKDVWVQAAARCDDHSRILQMFPGSTDLLDTCTNDVADYCIM